MTSGLFADLPVQAVPERAGGGRPRLRTAERGQADRRAVSLDDLVPADHRVRLVWRFVEGLDLAALMAEIKAVEVFIEVATAPDFVDFLTLPAYRRCKDISASHRDDEAVKNSAACFSAYGWPPGAGHSLRNIAKITEFAITRADERRAIRRMGVTPTTRHPADDALSANPLDDARSTAVEHHGGGWLSENRHVPSRVCGQTAMPFRGPVWNRAGAAVRALGGARRGP